ncbi:heat shock protein STI-like, partial [Trifolium medium]|nr:heat shock protein STI-like [Trifolium medium]
MADEARAKGNAAFSSGDFATAILHFSEAIDLSPTNHVLCSNRSAAYASLQNYIDALADAKKTVKLKPHWSKGYSRLGAAYYGLSQYDNAVWAYKQGLEIDPNNEPLKSGLADAQKAAADGAKAKGNAAFSSGDFATAIRHFSEAINLTPSDHVLYSNRSAAYASLRNYIDALADAEKTVKLKPHWSKGYSRLGAAHYGLS